MTRRRTKHPSREEVLTPGACLLRALREGSGSGPAVARLFDRLLAAVFLVAWLSLGAQIDVLVGSHGLLPAAASVEALHAQRRTLWEAPSIFLWGASDGALHAGVWVGAALAVLALAGVVPRVCFALGTALYLSYAVVIRSFFGFQWDNLLLECGFLAAMLPRDRRAPWAHFLLRALLFKLYWESGVAKWQSPLHDWQDGSAMTYYYETAPLPARLAWYAHALPGWWHACEGWFTLFFELAVPCAIFAPRRARLGAAVVFTGFQVVNIATANYGFFSYLSLALHVFLLDDTDVRAIRTQLVRRFPALGWLRVRQRWLGLRVRRPWAWTPRVDAPWARRGLAVATVAAYVGVSTAEALMHFGGSPALVEDLAFIHEAVGPFRLVSTYHLFAAITRERIEPELQASDGVGWTGYDLRYKPGDVRRAPRLVAPHQPRVDFQLWFYGLSWQRGTPPWVSEMLRLACRDPKVVEPLFREALPEHPAAVRMAFFRYHFTTAELRRATGAWWWREPVGATRPVECGPAPE